MLVNARLAKTLPTPVYMNHEGKQVDNVCESVGCKVQTQLHLPQLCLVMYKVSGDLNMMNDGHFGDKIILSRKGNTVKINLTKKSKRFTVLSITNLAGEAIMCVIIF